MRSLESIYPDQATLERQVRAATPRFHRHSGVVTAIAIVAAMLAAMLLAAAAGTALRHDVSSILYLVALALSAVMGGLTYAFVWVFDRFHHDDRQRHLLLVGATLALAAFLVAWMSLMPLFIALVALPAFILCLPTSWFALWVLRRLQRNRTEAWWLVLIAVGWGCVVATNFAMVTEGAYSAFVAERLIPGPGLGIAQAFDAALFEEGGKGLAVLLLFVLFRNQFDGVVSGVVVGAAVGLGFNFMESIEYMALGGPGTLLSEFWYRQVVSLFLGHVTYTALIGAGFGIASQQKGVGRQAVSILAGFVAAVAAHFLWDALAITQYLPGSTDPVLSVIVVLPLQVLAVNGPFFLMAVALLLAGLREEGRALRGELEAEAAAGRGTIEAHEVLTLASPLRRLEARLLALSQGGFSDYQWVGRLQATQLDLATERWHRAQRRLVDPLEAEGHLRQRALILKHGRPAPYVSHPRR